MPRCALQPDAAEGDSADDVRRARTELKWLTGWCPSILVKYVSKPLLVIPCAEMSENELNPELSVQLSLS